MTTLGKFCDGGHTCSPPKDCCKQGCCYPQESIVYRPGPGGLPPSNMFTLVVGHWYFWAATTATLLGILCACSLWRRQNTSSGGGGGGGGGAGLFCCGDAAASRIGDEHVSEPDSNGSCYAPPQYSRCGSFHQAPPPYSEVTSKPDLYPLVINCHGDAIVKTNGTTTGYLMVQYFRNFIVRPVGTLSATSTIDSLSSSFICNAANEANNIIPPPYSCTGSLEEVSVVVTAGNNNNNSQVQSAQQSSQHAHRSTTSTPTASPPQPLPPPSTLVGLSPSQTQHYRDLVQQFLGDDDGGSTTATESAPTGNERQRRRRERDDEPPDAKRKALRLKEKFRPRQQHSLESESSDPEHNFSDLLNLSVCAPSSGVGVASSTVHTQSNPQVDMIYNSVTNSMTSSDISSLANLGTPDSPPRATSPTLEMRELLDKIQQLPAQHRSPISGDAPKLMKSYFNRSKAKTLYMPLTGGGEEKKRSWFPRSAPTTPCGCFSPNFPSAHQVEAPGGSSVVGGSKRSGSQKGSKSKLYDGSPLLHEHDESDEERS